MTAVALKDLAPLDKTFALKALGFDAKLSPTAMRVGMLIVEHFNLKTGRCFPSWPRLMKILGIDRSTLARALKQLRQRGYLRHQRHAEKAGASSYDPNWQLFREKATRVEHAAKAGTPLDQVAELPAQGSQDCLAGGGETATQSLEGSLQKSLQVSTEETEQEFAAHSPTAAPVAKVLEIEEGRAERSDPPRQPPRPRQKSFLLPIAGCLPRAEDSRSVASRKAWERIEGDILKQWGGYASAGYEKFCKAMTPTMEQDLTAAEMSKSGAGIAMAHKLVTGARHAA